MIAGIAARHVVSRAAPCIASRAAIASGLAPGKQITASNAFVPSLSFRASAVSSHRLMSTMADEIPTEMKRLVVTSPGARKSVADLTVEVETVPVPTPKEGEVLIKVVASPINPSDYMSWLIKRSYPAPIGYEGSGIVVSSGGGISTLSLKPGTKVGFLERDELAGTQGAYSEYVTAIADSHVFPMPDDVPVEDCCSFYVNPYMAYAIIDIVQRAGSTKAFVHTAAASQLGQMLVKLAPSKGIEIINVVRRQEQKELLEKLGAKHVVVTTGEPDTWKPELKAKIDELGATSAVDAIAGEMTGHLMDCLPPGGTVHIYGGLAGPASGLSARDLIYLGKKLDGILLNRWIAEGGKEMREARMYYAGKTVSVGLKSPDGWCCTRFQDTSLEKAHEDLLEQLKAKTTEKKLRIRF